MAIKMVASPSTFAVDIRSNNVAKHSTPSAVVPNIFICYYPANNATGELSGTILAECEWTAASNLSSPRPKAKPIALRNYNNLEGFSLL